MSPQLEGMDYGVNHQYIPQGMAAAMDYGRDPFWHGESSVLPEYTFWPLMDLS